MPESLHARITYLQQVTPPNISPVSLSPRLKTAIMRAENMPVAFYRYLYDAVGGSYHWVTRKRMDDEDLKQIIQSPLNYILVLYVDGVPAGFAEIDTQNSAVLDLKFFGLTTDYIGKGLGRFFLSHVLQTAWSLKPEKIILETCSLDHPAALVLYQKMGFSVYDQRDGIVQPIQ